MNENMEREGWLCRNCNTLVSPETKVCPVCSAEKCEENATEPLPEEIDKVVTRENYTNATPRPKSKYIFREAVLANVADIILVLGLFCTFGALIAPIIIDFDIEAPMMWAICVAIIIFAFTMISWAWLRSIAEISRMLRNRNRE